MTKVRIVTDSNAYLPPELLENYPIDVIPHRIKIGPSIYEEDEHFSADELFAKLQEAQSVGMIKLPEVQAADLNAILDCYQRLGREAEQIVSIHMSSELSPMWAQARKAAEMLKGRYTIRVLDSLSTAYGLGLLVEQAAKAADEGASVHEIARVLNGAIPHLYFAAFAESLHYLERSARLGPSQSLLGSMLGIKAMLMMEDGHLSPLEKVQTREEVVEKLFEFVIEFAHVERVGILHHDYGPTKDQLIERLTEASPGLHIEQITYPPSLAAYIGPETIGVMIYEGSY
jgi:DegV family protein with EDD domain